MRIATAVGCFFCAAAVGLCGTQPAAAAQPPLTGAPRPKGPEETLREAGLAGSPAALVKFFTDRTPKAGTGRLTILVGQLGSDDFRERQRASEVLPTLGAAAAPALMRVLSQADAEASGRAKECLQKVRAREDPVTCVLAVRELARLAPEKAPAVLLSRLPYAWPDEREAIWMALAKPGRPGAVYAKALSDREAARRALAGFLLARYGSDAQRKQAAALLKDADREVRLRVAQGLLGAGSSEGVPALIGLLSKEPEVISWQAEELLRWWAGEQGPRPGGDWSAWWKSGPVVKQAKRPFRPRLVLAYDILSADRLSLYGCDARRRWSLRDPGQAPLSPDFVFLPDSGAVVAMGHQPGRDFFAARDLRGRPLWERDHTPLTTPRVRRFPSGTLHTGGEEITPGGATVEAGLPRGLCSDELPAWDGHRLERKVDAGEVAEIDERGRVLWRAEVGGRLMAWLRLPGGGVVVSYHTKDGKDIVEEVGPAGKTGWRAPPGQMTRRLALPFPLVSLGF